MKKRKNSIVPVETISAKQAELQMPFTCSQSGMMKTKISSEPLRQKEIMADTVPLFKDVK